MTDERHHQPSPTPHGSEGLRGTLFRADTSAIWEQDLAVSTNPDGSFSFQLPNGQFVGVEPAYPGQEQLYIPHHGDYAGQYQRATLTGGIVTFRTRPGDYPQVFFFGGGVVYPA